MPLFILLAIGVIAMVLLAPKTALGYQNGKPITVNLAPITGGLYMRTDAAAAFNRMAADAADEGVILLPTGPRAAFRTQEDQQSLQVDRAGFANPVGYSHHQMGVAVDLTVHDSRDSEEYKWLAENGPDYGYHNTSQKEPWHWEYLANV